jgi:hypothetical protein
MRSYAKILVQQQVETHWKAWFAGSPHVTADGNSPAVAITRLLMLVGPRDFEIESTRMIIEAVRTGQLEFQIPFRKPRWMPTASIN